MRTAIAKLGLAFGVALLAPAALHAQQGPSTNRARTSNTTRLAQNTSEQPTAAEPAPSGSSQGQLPEVEVIQKKAPTQPKAAKKAAPQKKSTPPPTPAALPAEEYVTGAGDGASLVRTTPLGGSETAIGKVPGSVSVVPGRVISLGAYPNIADALQSRVPGVIATDLQGNSFNQDIFYHGFQSSPVNGVPQGLAVYQNGVRINEVYSDVVEWDTLPSVAIASMSIVSNNPAFGLNALGGSLSIIMKDGFTFQGFEADAGGGSYGRYQGSIQYGARSGSAATYFALEGLHEDGWRDFSPSDIRRMYADVGFKGDGSELHFSFTGADNFMGLAGSTGIEALEQRYENVFTTPQTTDNQLAMFAANGSTRLNETLSLSGNAYYRSLKQKHADGNISDLVECDFGPGDPNNGRFCFDEEDNLTNIPGNFDDDEFYGSIDRTSADADSGGSALQLVEKAKLFGHGNQFLIGASYDYGSVTTTASSEFGLIPDNFVVDGLGIIIEDDEGAVKPLKLGITTKYFGFYVADAFDVTPNLTVTVGGRYNNANLTLEDKLGTSPDLNGKHNFQRFNPMVGATYQLLPGLSLYGGYSESNRAPTPAELACADPEKPCLIESFLVADPDLKQVIARTEEIGLRGDTRAFGGKIDWTIGLFRSATEDEILNVAAEQQGRGFFLNAGDAIRQGVDVGLEYTSTRLSFYGNYSYVDAHADSSYTLFSENNPSATEIENDDGEEVPVIFVKPGDRLALIPRHTFKAGFDYYVTPKWKVGADVIMASNRIFLGDESNLNTPLPGYQLVNLRTSYDLTDHIQLYGLINNVFDQEHFLFGTYFDPDDVKNRDFSDPRSVMPGAPFGAYGGVKVKF